MLEKSNIWRILELFFKHPLYSFHLREICRLLKWSPTKVRNKLDLLKKKNLITEQKEKNLSIFKSNRESKEFKNYKIIYNLVKAQEISEIIENKLEEYEAIIFFGSALRGEDVENSDFDFCVIGSKEVEIDLKKVEKDLNRKISLIFVEDLEKLKKESPELLNNLINGYVVKGYLKVF
ncbi:MAG: nucleotidyltransferase domain-containing protein [Candidatus Aenigmarchaeota archaeon]|nr:nucleotidyltransferase domain-containing protein [Candidatus Aenigmarchaeota archaeon]